MAAAFGTLTAYDITNASLGATSARQSVGIDLGTTPLVAVGIKAIVAWAATPTADDYLDIFLAEGFEGTTTSLAGDATGTDAAYTAGRTDAMRFVMRVVVAATTNPQEKYAIVTLPARFNALVIQNASSATLSTTEGDCVFAYQTITYA